MALVLGVICALIAMVGWGVGDYFIQKTSRALGDWKTLFFISAFGAVVISPFIWGEITDVFSVTHAMQLLFLLAASLVLLAAALLEFESLKKGKLVVVEPLYALEIPVSGLLAFFFLSETITPVQVILILSLAVGLILVSLRTHHLHARIWLEKGVIIAILSTIFMGTINFLFGVGARQTSALMINWFTDTFLAIACLVYLVYKNHGQQLLSDLRAHKKPVFAMSICDTVAWIAFAYAMLLAPISISVALSQSYIIITVLFGMFVSHEKLQAHQKVGLVVAIVVAIALSVSVG